MRVFITYSFADFDSLEEIITRLKYGNFEVLHLGPEHERGWKRKSKKLILQADFVIRLRSAKSDASENVNWEVEYARNQSRRIYDLDLPINENTEEVLSQIVKREALETTLFNKGKYTIEDVNAVQDLYKEMLKTSESLIGRRQSMNTFFLSANGLLLSALGLLTGFNTKHDFSFLYNLGIGIAGFLLCLSWRALLISYGQLNRGKFAVLNTIEKHLPVSLFSAEWHALGHGTNKSRYRSFTESEKRIPVIFIFVYMIYFLSVLVFSILRLV